MKPTITTLSGQIINILDPEPDRIFVEDVATGLSNLCRFVGSTPGHYSVAQHANLVSLLCEEICQERGLGEDATVITALHGLHHDDAEFLFGDLGLIRSLTFVQVGNGDFASWSELEERANVKIMTALGIPLPDLADTDVVAGADDWALAIEWNSMGRPTERLGSRNTTRPMRPYRLLAAPSAKDVWLRRHQSLMTRLEAVLDDLGEVEL